MNTETTHILSASAVLSYLLGGKGTVTLLNRESERRHTYRIQAPGKTAEERRNAEILFVSVLTGPENTKDYSYIGIIVRRTGEFKTTKKSRLPMSDKRVSGFSWLMRQACRETLENYPHVEVRHHNRCGCCGRLLTVPQSIDTGLGPVCAKVLNVLWLRNDQRTVA